MGFVSFKLLKPSKEVKETLQLQSRAGTESFPGYLKKNILPYNLNTSIQQVKMLFCTFISHIFTGYCYYFSYCKISAETMN